jgi:hypothetical protein
MPVTPPTLRRLASAAGNPLANPVPGCEANDQSDDNFKHREPIRASARAAPTGLFLAVADDWRAADTTGLHRRHDGKPMRQSSTPSAHTSTANTSVKINADFIAALSRSASLAPKLSPRAAFANLLPQVDRAATPERGPRRGLIRVANDIWPRHRVDRGAARSHDRKGARSLQQSPVHQFEAQGDQRRPNHDEYQCGFHRWNSVA